MAVVGFCLLLLGTCVLQCCAAVPKLPPAVPLCKRKDPLLNQCLVEAIPKATVALKYGDRSLQMLPLDPLAVEHVVIEQGRGSVRLRLELHNASVTGLTDFYLTAVKADLDKYSILMEGLVPAPTLKGDYVMDGQFLVLPLRGTGRCSMAFKDVNATAALVGESMMKDGEEYMKITDFPAKVRSIGEVKFNFENLFNGNKALGDNTNRVLNANWASFWDELRPTFEETFGHVFEEIAKQVFTKVPLKDVFLET